MRKRAILWLVSAFGIPHGLLAESSPTIREKIEERSTLLMEKICAESNCRREDIVIYEGVWAGIQVLSAPALGCDKCALMVSLYQKEGGKHRPIETFTDRGADGLESHSEVREDRPPSVGDEYASVDPTTGKYLPTNILPGLGEEKTRNLNQRLLGILEKIGKKLNDDNAEELAKELQA